MYNLLQELKRRKVFRVAAVYAVAAWLLIQVADVVLPTFGAPGWVNQTIIFLFIIGIIPTLIAAWAYEVTPEGVRPDTGAGPATPATTTGDRKLIYATFALVLLVAIFQISDRFLPEPAPAVVSSDSPASGNAVTRISVNLPDDQFFHPGRGDFDLSDDGTMFVYRGIGEGGREVFYLRRWDELRGRPFGDNVGTRPHFSPDGQEVVFNASGQIKIAPVNGGLTRTLTEGTEGNTDTPAWSSDGEWIYFMDAQSGISRIPSAGGQVETIRSVNADNGEIELITPHVLPGDKQILYVARTGDGDLLIRATNLETGADKVLIAGKAPMYSHTGHLLFQDSDSATLLAAPFDLETLELTGSPVTLATGLLQVGRGGAANIGLSRTGRLIYRVGNPAGGPGQPVWVSRDGEATVIDPDWQVATGGVSGLLSLSPDGDRIAYTEVSGPSASSDVWVKRLDQGPLSRLTFAGGLKGWPMWSADGQSVLYTILSNGRGDIWIKNADGSGGAERLFESPDGVFAGERTISPDGRWLVFRRRTGPINSGGIVALDLQTEAAPVPLVENDFWNRGAVLSSEGNLLAYVSDETGRDEVYVTAFPDRDGGR